MKIKKYLIAGGNPTLLVWGCLPQQKEKIIKQYLGEVEQIGFVSASNRLPKLSMMGNELCINATIALASDLEEKSELLSSGFTSKIFYRNKNGITEIHFNAPYERLGDAVLLPGIGFIFSADKKRLSKEFLSLLARMFRLPAFGIVVLKGNQITPYVYVQQTNSLFEESACGSGSIATNILTGIERVFQPTGETITVQRRVDSFTVSARVVKINL